MFYAKLISIPEFRNSFITVLVNVYVKNLSINHYGIKGIYCIIVWKHNSLNGNKSDAQEAFALGKGVPQASQVVVKQMLKNCY